MKNFIFTSKRIRLFFTALFIVLFFHSYSNSIALNCSDSTKGYIGTYFEYSGVNKSIGIKDISKLIFKNSSEQVLNLGLNDSTYWLHSKLIFESDCIKYFEFDSQGIDTLEVFLFRKDTLVKNYLLGSNVKTSKWPLPSHKYAFPVESSLGDTLDLYIRMKSSQQLLVPIQFKSEQLYWKNNLKDNLVYGIYFGIISVMIFYNLFLYFSVRDVNYLYYIAYIFFVGMAQASILGYAQSYLWPNVEWLRLNGTILMGSLSGIFTLLFVINFLRTRRYTPFLHIVLWVAVGFDVLAIILLLFGVNGYNIVNSVAAIGSVIVIITALSIMRKGYLPAKFFLVAYSFFLLSVIVFVLKDFSILPFNDLTTKSMIYGSSFEIVLLSLALANRINVLREEKETSQAEALKALRENEKIIREQNVLLEQRVNERTLELQEANEELTVTLSNLKDTQTQLVDAEKMASLGQLTAGIAHEINNPINFVTSNIKPLKRDLADVYELVEAYSIIETEEMEDALKKAHELKEEIDYDYLKEEIESLVQGISDGANRTSEIVRGLKNFSRLDEDVVKPADLHEGLSSTIVLLQSKIKEGIKVIKDFDENLPKIDCYPGKLNQVFMNILNNGIYAVSHKNYVEDEAPTLTLKTQMNGNMASVHLIDNGIGMDEATKKKIFDPFFTTKDVGEGTGLGMSIVYKIIEKHGGNMTVNSELGKGTEFIITLPLSQPNEFE
ncbi:7TM diverse intracellular signaling domain-containing protein [Owenweeksia hongkongensis]|uniref:sensor histidine kinase n=1 Tax=Owenweeksia hongkongensis TaxID=253245 RepID=UPI003A93A65C